MSQPSQNYIDKVVRWTYGQVDLARMNIPLAGQFRARLALECYMLWQQNKTSNIRRMVQNIAARDYAMLMQNAALGSEEAQAMVKALGITRNEETGAVSARRETEIANDIYVVNQLVGRLSVAKNHIQRAMYEDNIEWLIGFARKTGNVTAMREAQRNLEKINNDFKDEQNPADAMKPGAERNITGDISIIKPDRTNYTDEELKAFAKKIGAKFEDVQEMIQNEDGVYVSAEGDDAPDDEEQEQEMPADDMPDDYDPFKR
jgi:HAMP domain-containing protein